MGMRGALTYHGHQRRNKDARHCTQSHAEHAAPVLSQLTASGAWPDREQFMSHTVSTQLKIVPCYPPVLKHTARFLPANAPHNRAERAPLCSAEGIPGTARRTEHRSPGPAISPPPAQPYGGRRLRPSQCARAAARPPSAAIGDGDGRGGTEPRRGAGPSGRRPMRGGVAEGRGHANQRAGAARCALRKERWLWDLFFSSGGGFLSFRDRWEDGAL